MAQDQGSAPKSGDEKKSRSSFWETVGRAAGKGVKAAVDAGHKLSAEADGAIEREARQKRLSALYQDLGKLVAERLSAAPGAPLDAGDAEIQKLLAEIREARG
jgi:hypothetical protein